MRQVSWPAAETDRVEKVSWPAAANGTRSTDRSQIPQRSTHHETHVLLPMIMAFPMLRYCILEIFFTLRIRLISNLLSIPAKTKVHRQIARNQPSFCVPDLFHQLDNLLGSVRSSYPREVIAGIREYLTNSSAVTAGPTSSGASSKTAVLSTS